MTRKTALLEGNTSAPIVEEEDKLESEFDEAETQEKILKPTSAEIEIGDEKIYLPYEFSIDMLFRQKVMNNLKYVYMLIQSELKHVRSGPLEQNDPLCIAVLYKNSVQEALFELLSVITKTPVSRFENKLDDKATIGVFTWLILAISNTYKDSGDTKKK